jgi:glyoxylase-like metal-dependent hydrolase (beta-lactamase superfamily II)
LGIEKYIAACVLADESGIAVIDPGPTSSLEGLERGLAAHGLATADIHTLLLTHIHLDHAGATGTLVKRHPGMKVYVHSKGARHMIDPAKLIASAERIYGLENMDRLWGEFLATPAENVTVLEGGETITVGGRKLEIEYTPGHASHHVSYFDQSTGIGFTGDTTGMRPFESDVPFPVTPPPDIDLAGWKISLEKIRRHKPERIFLTHFGPFTNPEEHLAQLEERLARWGEVVADDVKSGRDETVACSEFVDKMRGELTAIMPRERFGPMIRRDALISDWHGLARYWRKNA